LVAGGEAHRTEREGAATAPQERAEGEEPGCTAGRAALAAAAVVDVDVGAGDLGLEAVFVDLPVAVLVHAVAQLGRTREGPGVVVVAVLARGVAVSVGVVEILVDETVAVVVRAVRPLAGAGVHGGVAVVAVAVPVGEPVAVVV